MIFSLAAAGMNVAPPAQATTLCPPGTYVSSYDATICNPTPPGTFTFNSGEIQPLPCPLGKYQPFYGQTSCLNTPAGTSNAELRAQFPGLCPKGRFQENPQAAACTLADPGTYVSTDGATSPTPCPVAPTNATLNSVRTGNTKPIQCFDFSGNSLVSPRASSTMDNELKFEFYLANELAYFDTLNPNLKFTLVNASNSSLVYQVVASAYPDNDRKRVTYSFGTNWTNSNSLKGCVTACPGTAITGIPLGTYNVTVEARDLLDTWVSFSANSVVISDTVTTLSRAYLFSYSYFPISGSARVGIGFPESYLAGSVSIKLSNRPYYLTPTATRTYQLSSGTLPANVLIELSGSGITSDVVAVSGSTITPGQWWVSMSYQDARGNAASTDEWPYPLLITIACSAGNFSVNGIESCVQVPAGYQIDYPSISAFGGETKVFAPSQCEAGTYQPNAGGAACLLAEPGSFVSQAGSIVQMACPLGKFQPSAGSAACLEAAAGNYTNSTRSIAMIPCDAGTYQTETGQTSCVRASAGHYVSSAGSPSQSECASGTYQPNAGGTACLPAEAGSYTNSTGSIATTPCAAGSYQAAAGQTSCVLASANHFVASAGQISQTPCQSGYSQPTSGSTSCVVTPASATPSTPLAPIVCPALTYATEGATSTADCKPRPCVVAKGKSATSACMLASVAQTLPPKAKVSIKMNRSFKKTCKVSGSKVKALRAGSCTVTLTVKPKKGKSTKYTVNVTGT